MSDLSAAEDVSDVDSDAAVAPAPARREVSATYHDINESGVEALAGELAHCRSLDTLNLALNPSITSRGYQALSTLLENPNSTLRVLNLRANGIDDESALILAKALVRNNTLEQLNFGSNANITAKGWAAFSKVLCDTTSINSTFLSNHTIKALGKHRLPRDVNSLLSMNQGSDKKRVASRKILHHHASFDVQPLFEWDLKVLPFVVGWFERAGNFEMEPRMERRGRKKKRADTRKLAAIYQFIRGMPELAINGITGVNTKSDKVGGEKRLHSAAFEESGRVGGKRPNSELRVNRAGGNAISVGVRINNELRG